MLHYLLKKCEELNFLECLRFVEGLLSAHIQYRVGFNKSQIS